MAPSLKPGDDGPWVKFTDHQAKIEALEAERDSAKHEASLRIRDCATAQFKCLDLEAQLSTLREKVDKENDLKWLINILLETYLFADIKLNEMFPTFHGQSWEKILEDVSYFRKCIER